MKKSTVISIGLIVLGFVFECLYLGSDTLLFKSKFWLLGFISILVGFIGLFLSTAVPLLDYRAKKTGEIKKKSIVKKSRNQPA